MKEIVKVIPLIHNGNIFDSVDWWVELFYTFNKDNSLIDIELSKYNIVWPLSDNGLRHPRIECYDECNLTMFLLKWS